MTLNELMDRFPDEEACRAHFQARRWPNGVRCPRCGMGTKIYAVKKPAGTWVCKQCDRNGYRFSLTTGTVFENTKCPLRTWFQVIYLMCRSKKGISANQIRGMIDPTRGKEGSYRTAWYMCHRIRAAMKDDTLRKLTGVVELDETYIGGKLGNKHARDRERYRRMPRKGKAAVIGAISRKGNVVAKMVERTNEATLRAFVNETISDRVSLVATDEAGLYQSIDWKAPHETVEHAKGEYVRGNVHTANLDSFWSLLKRGVVGTYHKMSKDYLPLYLNEFAFRHNNRKNADIFDRVLASC